MSTEIALSFALLTGALLVATSLRELARRDPGYDVDGLIAADVRLPAWRYTQAAARADIFERMMSDVRRHHAVRDVALADGVPLRIGGYFGRIQIDGRPRDDSPTQFDGADIDTAFLAIIGQLLRTGIFGIAHHSARSWALAATVLLVVTILALSVPALRAARVEPMRSIRADG